jgi:hypothetical protein
MALSVRARLILLCSATAIVIGAVFGFTSRYKQPAWYHDFADQRPLLGIPHMMNVVSNAPFVAVGIWGLLFMAGPGSRRPGAFADPRERWPYWVYFVGLLLTGIGSAYYHAEPYNERLVWDRLPLMVTFMGLFAGVLAERVSVRVGVWSLAPLVALATGSVVQWHASEQAGAGDMRFYLVVQFYSIAALVALMVLFRPKYTGTNNLVGSLLAYGIAKGLEALDKQIYAQAGIVSGHTLKHLVAGLGAYLILHMLQTRRVLG